MNVLYGLFNAGLAIAAYALLPKEYSEYIALGLIIFISSINRWELNKILKALKANTKNESEVLNMPRVINSVCPKCGSTDCDEDNNVKRCIDCYTIY